ncbi:hypothetical protein P9112_012179 [Eukaryota sp. TZLM1-RC]
MKHHKNDTSGTEQQAFHDLGKQSIDRDVTALFKVDTGSSADIKASRKRLHHDLVLAGDPSVLPVKRPPIHSKKAKPLSTSEEVIIKRHLNKIKQSSQPTTAVSTDIWSSKPTNTKPSPKTLPDPGQSYRPDPEHHEQLLDKATSLAVEEDQKVQDARSLMPKKAGDLAGMHVSDVAHYPGDVRVSYSTSIRSRKNRNEDEVQQDDVDQVEENSNQKKRKSKSNGSNDKDVIKEEREKKIRREGHLINQYINEVELAKFEKSLSRPKTVTNNTKPPRLGPVKYKEPLPDVLTKSEIPTSLSSVPIDGSALEDSYDCILRKGLIEPRNRQIRKTKHRVKLRSRGLNYEDVLKERN